MARIAIERRGVGQAPEVSAIKAKLHHFGLGLEEKRDVLRVVVLGPVSHHAGELEAWGILREGCWGEAECEQAEEDLKFEI